MLDRIGAEVAVATSLVRYAPGSRFPVHVHDRGEEYLVLDGVFSDASGDYGAGSYVRNPPGTSHAPWTDPGATILVKLRQFDPADREPCAIDTTTAQWQGAAVPGTTVLRLHDYGEEQVRMYRVRAGVHVPARTVPGGEEIFVVSGVIEDADGTCEAGTWIRNPPGTAPGYRAATHAVLWVKRGHLHPQFGPDRWGAIAAAATATLDAGT